MPTVKGRDAVARYMAEAREALSAKVLPGAARAGAAVVADEIRRRANAELVRDNVIINRRRTGDGRIAVRITVKDGFAMSLAIWQEYSTSPHFIRVDDEQREGRSAGRVNRLDKAAAQEGRSGPGHALVIGGNFVTGTVFHPGARAEPFFRTSLDLKEAEALAAAQGYINARVARMRRAGLTSAGDAEQ